MAFSYRLRSPVPRPQARGEIGRPRRPAGRFEEASYVAFAHSAALELSLDSAGAAGWDLAEFGFVISIFAHRFVDFKGPLGFVNRKLIGGWGSAVARRARSLRSSRHAADMGSLHSLPEIPNAPPSALVFSVHNPYLMSRVRSDKSRCVGRNQRRPGTGAI
jgi:hypothetical protein